MPSPIEATSTSTSPSPSRSRAATDQASVADAVTTCVTHGTGEVEVSRPQLYSSWFSYHETVCASSDASRTSTSPSPSRSSATTARRPDPLFRICFFVKLGVAVPSFRYHARSLVREVLESDADRTSMFASPSTSAA